MNPSKDLASQRCAHSIKIELMLVNMIDAVGRLDAGFVRQNIEH